MKCPVCKLNDLESCVYSHGGSVTAMYCQSYYDSGGNYHVHDSNERTFMYSCSHGHRWKEISNNRCPSCDFGHGEPTIIVMESLPPNPIADHIASDELIAWATGTWSVLTIS